MRDFADSWTYCVVVSNDYPGGGGERTFRDFVTAEQCYFHPYGWGSGWPKTPPNFLAFRWGNQVQRLHRVVSSEVVPSLQSRWPDIPAEDGTDQPHMLYHLGPPIPGPPFPSDGNYRAARVWFVLDQLLVSGSLREAIQLSKALRLSFVPTAAGAAPHRDHTTPRAPAPRHTGSSPSGTVDTR